MKRTSKNIISFLTSFVLMFFLIIMMVLSFFKFIVFDEHFYYKVLDETRAIETAEESILFEMKYVLLSNNLPKELADEIITYNEINDSVYSLTSDVLDYFTGESNEIKNIDVKKYSERIVETLENYLLENNITTIDSEYFEEVKTMVENIISTEIEPIDLNQISTSEYGTKIRDITKVLNSYIPLLIVVVVSIILMSILVIIWRRLRAVAWIGYSFFASGILMFLLGFSGYMSKFYNNIAVVSEIVKENIARILEKYLVSLSIMGGVFFGIGLICMIIYWIYIYKKEKRIMNK